MATPTSRRGRRSILAGAALVYLALFVPLALLESWPFVAGLAKIALGAAAVLAAAWLLYQLWRRALWRVGRRLAFSYFLVGVLPLGLLAVLLALAAYLLSGFLLGHLYRDAIDGLRDELEAAALTRLEAGADAEAVDFAGGKLRFAEYRRGRAVGGGAAPPSWPVWLETAQRLRSDVRELEMRKPFVALGDGALSLAAVASDGNHGVLTWFEGDLAAALRERTRTWFELFRADDPRQVPTTRIEIAGRVLSFRGLGLARDTAAEAEYYRLDPPRVAGEPAWRERPLVLWTETTGELRALSTGRTEAQFVDVSLAASPRGLFRALLSASEQADSTAWLALAGVAILLFEIWLAAAGMAVFMIVGLSRAVNRLSSATEAVARGDFSVRIPARRKDQLGELQRSFNEMAEHLGELVTTAAQKEALDKELALARRVQRDLLPDLIEGAAEVDLATTFEPSAAIGGDYYDILRRPSGRLAVVMADVAGHGLAAGLRMAMVKSALTLLAEEPLTAGEIVARLRRLLRARPGDRGFVTLSFAEFDPSSGALEITNAGHPPCYAVRHSGKVEELLFPGPPLGALDGAPGEGCLVLARGDAVVWLSDGIPECLSAAGEPFGYERIGGALAGVFRSAEELRDRLLAALDLHCGSIPTQDDKTLLVMRYVPSGEERPSNA